MIATALWLALTALVVAGETADGPPAPDVVVGVAEPPTGDRVLAAASYRVRAELAASGFEIRPIARVPEGDQSAADAPEVSVRVAVALARSANGIAIHAWAARPAGPGISRRIVVPDANGGDDPAVVAIRAVELLRDLGVGLDAVAEAVPARARLAIDDEDPSRPGARGRPPTPMPMPWRLSAGLARLSSPANGASHGLGPAYGPALEVEATLQPHWWAAVELSGPFRFTLSPPGDGSSWLRQALALLSLRCGGHVDSVRLFGAALVGVNYFDVQISDGQVLSTTVWTALAGGGGGASVDPLPGLTIGVEGDVFLTSPSVVAAWNGTEVGRAGRPSVLVLATVGLAFTHRPAR